MNYITGFDREQTVLIHETINQLSDKDDSVHYFSDSIDVVDLLQ